MTPDAALRGQLKSLRKTVEWREGAATRKVIQGDGKEPRRMQLNIDGNLADLVVHPRDHNDEDWKRGDQ